MDLRVFMDQRVHIAGHHLAVREVDDCRSSKHRVRTFRFCSINRACGGIWSTSLVSLCPVETADNGCCPVMDR